MIRKLDDHASFLIALLLLGLLSGCGEVEGEPPLDEEGDPIPVPQAFDDWLVLEQDNLRDPLPPRPRIVLRFSDYIDPDEFVSYGLMRLRSGGISARGDVRYVMRARAIEFRPFGTLREGLRYELGLDRDELISATGAPLYPLDEEQAARRFTVEAGAPALEHDLPEEQPRSWEDVRTIFAARCDRCHSDPEARLPGLEDYPGLMRTRSTALDRMLVLPFDPADSYLMHKILPDYADRLWGVQPPSWDAESQPLGEDEIDIIEQWIAQGAPGPDPG